VGLLMSMHKLIGLTFLLSVLLIPADAGAPASGNFAVESPRNFHLRTGAVRLFYSDQTMASFRQRMSQNVDVRAAWEKHKAEADRLLGVPVEKINIDPRQIQRAIEPLTLAYRMTDDKRYARKLYDIFHRLCSQKQWVTDKPLLEREPHWNADLGMGFLADIVGISYDSIRDALSPAERKEITAGLLRGVVEPVFADWIDGRTRIHTLDTMGHNWWAHIVFGTGVGLIAILQDEPRAASYLDRIDRAAVEWWNYPGSDLETKTETFDAQGGYSESINYAGLAIGTYMDFLAAWKQAIVEPPKDIPELQKAIGFFFANAYPASGHGLSTNFGDGHPSDSNGSIAIADAWVIGDHNPEYLWYLQQFNPNSHDEDVRFEPRFLVNVPLPSESGGKGAQPYAPLSAWYKGMGWATMRSSWDKDATFLATRSGMTWNHNHADAGSFILWHKGKPLLIDSGNSSYATKEYDQYFRQPFAHNVVQWNGKAEPAEDTYLGSHLPGSIPVVFDHSGVRYIFDDATGPTSANFQRNLRHFLWLDGVILVIDDLKAYEPGQFEWLLHTEVDAKREGAALMVRNSDAAVKVMPLFPTMLPTGGFSTDYPELLRLEERSGYRDHHPEQRQPYYAFVAPEKSERMKFVVALIPQTDGPQPVLERLTTPDGVGIRIRNGEKVTDVFLNPKADGSIRHRNAINNLMGWQTDAYMLVVTYTGKPTNQNLERVFIADGSYLRHDGATLFDSLSKQFLSAELTAEDASVWIEGPSADFTFDVVKPHKSFRVNGQVIDTAAGKSTVRVDVSQP